MRRGMELIVGMAAACGLLMLMPQPSRAAGVEKSLLGVRILQTYREVLKLYGAPTRVYRINETVLVQEAIGADGEMTGGVLALESGSGGGGMPGAGGAPGSGGGGRGPGAPSSAGGGGGGMRQPGGKGGGMQQPGGKGGGPSSAGGGGIGSSASSESSTTFAEAGGYIWAYHYPFTEKLYLFVFSAQGRLLITFERGRFGGGGTSNGINLGSSLKSVYDLYGWPDNVEEQGPGIVMNYSQKRHLFVAVIKGKVVGLAISLFELPRFSMLDDNGGSGGGGGGKGGGGMQQPGGKGGGRSASGASTAD